MGENRIDGKNTKKIRITKIRPRRKTFEKFKLCTNWSTQEAWKNTKKHNYKNRMET